MEELRLESRGRSRTLPRPAQLATGQGLDRLVRDHLPELAVLEEPARVAVAAYGFATDTAIASAGLASYAGSGRVSPIWMVGLWAVFGVVLTASLRRVACWPPLLLALLCAVAGPLRLVPVTAERPR